MSTTRGTFGRAWRAWAAMGVMLGGLGLAGTAQADEVVDHLVRQGMRRRTATTVVKKISRKMTANAARGGNDYDRVRQAIGMALFGASGAGGTLEEYNARLAQVLAKLDAGLDLWSLSALFGGETIVSCKKDFGVSAKDCRGLVSAASVAPVVDVDGLLAEARSAFQAGNYSRAAEAYEQVTLARPSEAAAFAGLGQSRTRIGDGRGAVQALRRAIELAPNVANLRAYLGRALMASGDRNGAGAAFREALALNSNHADAKAGLRELESAPASNQRPAVAAAPSAAPAANAPRFGTPRFGTPAPAPTAAPAASSAAASSAPRFGAPARASAPNPVAIQWIQKGQAHLQARQFTQALSAFQMGASFDPNNAGAFAGIGAASMGTGDKAGAARAMQTATRLAPDNADYHAGLGAASAGTGDRDTAIAAYRRALSVQPGHRGATTGLAALESGGTPAPTVVASAAPAPAPAAPARFAPSSSAVSTVAVAPQAQPAPRSPAPVVAPTPAPAPTPVAAPEPAVVAEPEPEPVPEPTVEEDDLIAGLLSDPLGPTTARGRSPAPAPAAGGSSTRAATPAPRAAAAPVAAAASSSGEGLPQTPSRDQVAAVMRDLLSTVKACVPDQTGVISVQMSITGATGEVADASVVGREADDPEAICVSEVVRGATFPRFSKEKLAIKFPFQL